MHGMTKAPLYCQPDNFRCLYQLDHFDVRRVSNRLTVHLENHVAGHEARLVRRLILLDVLDKDRIITGHLHAVATGILVHDEFDCVAVQMRIVAVLNGRQ